MVLVLTLGGSGFFMSYLSDVINGQRLREAMVVAATRHHTGERVGKTREGLR